MNSFQFSLIIITGLLFTAGISGFVLLKIYDEFRKAIEKNNRIRLWYALSLSMFVLLGSIVGFSGLGTSIKNVKPFSVSLHSDSIEGGSNE